MRPLDSHRYCSGKHWKKKRVSFLNPKKHGGVYRSSVIFAKSSKNMSLTLFRGKGLKKDILRSCDLSKFWKGNIARNTVNWSLIPDRKCGSVKID